MGVDNSPAALAAAHAADPEATTILADMDRLEPSALGVGQFDLVQLVMSLQYSDRPDAVLTAAFNALRPGGQVIVIVPHPVSWGDERTKLDDAGHHLRQLGYRIVAGDDGADVIDVFGSYRREGPVHWRAGGTDFILRPPSRIHGLLTEAGFNVRRFEEPGPPQDLSDEQIATIAPLANCSEETLRMFIKRTTELAHVAAFSAFRPS